jgi:predicted Zn-dependent protease
MLKEKLLGLLLLQFVCLSSVCGANQDAYQKGWDAFTGNNRTEARNYFNQAIVDGKSKEDALLSLCLLDWNESKLDAAFDDFCKFYEISSNPYPYLYTLSGFPFLFEPGNVLPPKKLAFLEKIVTNPNMNGTLKAMLYDQLGLYYEKINNMKKAKECYNKMGVITHWQVLGTFDNTSGSGFSKDWGAVTKAKVSDVFKNKVDAEIKWYTPSFNKANNWFYFDYYFYMNSAIMYAQSFVTSPTDQEVYLRTGTSGSLKVWVNDALVSTVPEERNCDLDIYAYKIKLNKGTNRLLVQIGQSEIDQANFLLRLTDANAHPIQGLSDAAVFADYTKSTDQTSPEMLPFFAETFHAEKVKESPENTLYSFLLAETYLRNDKSYEATKILKSLQEKTPKSSLLSYRLAEAYQRAKNKTDYDKEKENIKLFDPNSFYGLQEAYNEAVKSEKYTNAADISKKTKELYGESNVTEDWDLNIASYQKRYPDVIAQAKVLYKKYPYRDDYMNINYEVEKDVSKSSKSATAIVENYCKNYFSTDALETLSKIYFDQGNADKGLAILKRRIDAMPYATGYIDNLATILFDKQRYKEALSVTDQMLALSPYLPGAYSTRGSVYKSMKEDELAKESFRKSIYYEPTSYDSRSQLRLLENKKEVNELFPKINLDDLISKAPSSTEYPQDNSLLLLNDNQLVVYPEGAKEYRYEIAIKILNKSGIENWKEYTAGYNSYNQKLIIDKAELIKANGTKAKAETNDNVVVFSNLEVNDVLHLDYRVQDLSTGKLANHFFDHFLFQYRLPSVINRYSILVPKNKTFDYVVKNGNIQPTVSDVEDMKLYQWESKNLPAIKSEPYMSALTDIAPTLYYSSMPDWKYVSNWYHDLSYSKFNTDYVLKETVANLLKGKENLSPLEKAKIFYYYVLENISYSNVSFLHSNFIPQKASRTITTRLGDCKDVSTLFVALCHEADIKANLVLISTRNYGNSTLPLPSVNFNHCIAQLNLDGKTYYLELTDNKLPFGAAHVIDLKSDILPIPFVDDNTGDKLIKMDMPFRPKNIVNREHSVTISDKDMLIARKSVYFESFASLLRNRYRNIGTEEQLKQISQSVASNFTVPIKVTDLKFTNLDNLVDSMAIEYNLSIKNLIQDVAGMKIFNLPWTEKFSSLDVVTEETRKYPLEFWSFLNDDMNSEVMNVILPKGKAFVEIPQNVYFDCANASYQLTFNTKTPGKVIIHRIFQRKTEQVMPQEYTAFRNFINKVSESDNKQYAIK